MNSVLAATAPSAVGPVVLVLLFLLLTAGLALVVRLLTARLDRTPRRRPEGGAPPEAGEGAAAGDARHAGGEERLSERPVTGRLLKERYLSGRITRAEYERELRRLQIEESLREER